MEEHVDTNEDTQPQKKQKKLKLKVDESQAGIIYLSKIPTYMNVKRLRQMMEQYGGVGRIYLQADGG